MYTSELSFFNSNKDRQEKITLQMDVEPRAPEDIVNQLASIKGAVDLYFWYEGSIKLPESGAQFMTDSLFKPLYQLKNDITLCLYSLNAWSFKKSVQEMPISALGKAINRMNKPAALCIDSSLFFQYCVQQTSSSLSKFISDRLPTKTWLYELSKSKPSKGMTVSAFFNKKTSLFSCIKDLDLSQAYSAMQYIEAYYLVRESVLRGLKEGRKTIDIAFVLPNDEGKYYSDLKDDINEMLQLELGKEIKGIEITISFQFFIYGEDKDCRPYIDKQSKGVKPKEVSTYFDYLPENDFLKNAIR